MGSDRTARDRRDGDAPPGRGVAIVGAGGNIGSHLVPHIARMQDVERIVLVDPDAYDESNLAGQEIAVEDVGMPKVEVQGERARRIRPRLRIEAFRARVERIPPGALRADAILACLDSRGARQYVNEIAWRLGVPWIDSGVDGGGLLARVNVYFPDLHNTCLECSWGPRDYELVEQTYACGEGSAAPAEHPTRAPSSLGALAAALQAIECRKLLDGEFDRGFAGGEVLVDARHHNVYRTRVSRNPDCLMDHSVWPVGRAARVREIGTAAEWIDALAPRTDGLSPDTTVEALGSRFVTKTTCSSCGRSEAVLRLERSIGEAERRCGACGGMRLATGADIAERVPAGAFRATSPRASLHSHGIREGEILRVSGGGGIRIVEVTA
jgi:molybdopterin/thiamine biosynthesis adenylyltransferase